MKIHSLSLFLFALLVLGQVSAQQHLGHQTLLWQISGKNLEKPSYVLGTIHMICKDSFQLHQSVQRVLKTSDTLVLEMDISNPEAVAQYVLANSASKDSLSKGLTEAEKTHLAEKLAAFGLPLDKFELMKPFVLSMLLTQSLAPPCPITSVDQEVSAHWNNPSAMAYLETPEIQMNAMDKAIDRETLLITLENFEDQQSALQKLMGFYLENKIDSIQSMMFSEDAGSRNFMEHLLINRNKNWVEAFTGYDPEKSYFLAVGAGHLPGENGLIALLRKAGYTVTPISS